MQLVACDVFTDILRRKLCPVQTYCQYFLQTMFQCMDSKDPQLADRWVEALIDVINLLPRDVVAKKILPKTVTRGNVGHPVGFSSPGILDARSARPTLLQAVGAQGD